MASCIHVRARSFVQPRFDNPKARSGLRLMRGPLSKPRPWRDLHACQRHKKRRRPAALLPPGRAAGRGRLHGCGTELLAQSASMLRRPTTSRQTTRSSSTGCRTGDMPPGPVLQIWSCCRIPLQRSSSTAATVSSRSTFFESQQSNGQWSVMPKCVVSPGMHSSPSLPSLHSTSCA